MDCGDTYTISLENTETGTDFEDGIYYADNLPAEYKEEDLMTIDRYTFRLKI